MKYGSVCSGVEAATVAWHSLGWEPQWFSEIEKFPSAVLEHHYPDVPNLGDMTKFKEWKDDPIDLLVGGTPCQSFSVAGLRKGLDDPRGNLMLTYLAIADRYKPRWLVWENVPGVLSSNRGRDFGTFLGALGQIGYGFAYRVLDAQYFGVAQRRRRVFVVGYLGDWRRAAAVLFERESLSGHPAPSREPREEVAKCLTRGVGQRYDPETETLPVAFDAYNNNVTGDVTKTIDTGQDYHHVPITFGAQNSATQGHLLPIAFSSKDYSADALDDLCPTLRAGGHNKSHANAGVPPAVAFGGDVVRTLSARHDSSPCADRGMDVIVNGLSVRRLTPRECERLQGFPDDYTLIPYRNKLAADGPRYKAMGNSMAVPVMRWIGQRINEVDKIK